MRELIYKYGANNIETDIPITEPKVDVKVFGIPVSIKTITGGLNGIKLIWTVDFQKAKEFLNAYHPSSDLLIIQIKWGSVGKFCFIPLEVQVDVFNKVGKEQYIKLPKPGTNPRGVEISKNALEKLIDDARTRIIEIPWKRQKIEYNPYKRWVDYWKEK